MSFVILLVARKVFCKYSWSLCSERVLLLQISQVRPHCPKKCRSYFSWLHSILFMQIAPCGHPHTSWRLVLWKSLQQLRKHCPHPGDPWGQEEREIIIIKKSREDTSIDLFLVLFIPQTRWATTLALLGCRGAPNRGLGISRPVLSLCKLTDTASPNRTSDWEVLFEFGVFSNKV